MAMRTERPYHCASMKCQICVLCQITADAFLCGGLVVGRWMDDRVDGRDRSQDKKVKLEIVSPKPFTRP